MAQWTHFIGTIQCDSTYEEVEEALGKPVLWHDSDKLEYGSPEYEDYMNNVWAAAFTNFKHCGGIPMGSEGSVNWKFCNTSEIHPSVFGEGALIAIEGDLRNFGSDKEVELSKEWFIAACNALGARSAILRIEVEWRVTYIIEYDYQKLHITTREQTE